jgi:hypothetical protein
MRCLRYAWAPAIAGLFACSEREPAQSPPVRSDREPAVACAPGQCPPPDTVQPLAWPYDELIGNERGVGLGCPAVSTALEAHGDAGLGFEAQTVIDLVSGSHRESLRWVVGSAPSSASTQLSVEIEVIGGAQLLVRNRADLAPADAPPGAVPSAHCANAIGLPVRVRLQSDDGVLDGSVESTLESSYADFARLAFVLPASALPSASGGTPDPELAVELGVTPLGVMGSLSLHSRQLKDGASDPIVSQVAHFPADRYCAAPDRQFTSYSYTSQLYLAPEQEFRGISLEGQLARLNRASPVSARTSITGPQSQFSFAFTTSDDHLCLELESRGCYTAIADIAASVRWSTDDASVDGEIPLSLRLKGDSDPLAISTRAFRGSTSLDDAPAVVQSFGVHAPIDYTGQDGADMFFSAVLEGEVFEGSLAVLGWRSCGPECKSGRSIWMLDWGWSVPPSPYSAGPCSAPRPLRR